MAMAIAFEARIAPGLPNQRNGSEIGTRREEHQQEDAERAGEVPAIHIESRRRGRLLAQARSLSTSDGVSTADTGEQRVEDEALARLLVAALTDRPAYSSPRARSTKLAMR